MESCKIIDVLEDLSVVLGTVRDVLEKCENRDSVEREIDVLEKTVVLYRGMLEDDSKIWKLIRLNRELNEQLALIRIVLDDSRKLSILQDLPEKD